MGYNLDRYQQDAVETRNRNALIVAAPGSGKTTVIINRVNHLVNHIKIPDKNIIIITFTKAAAVNMKKRYESRFNTNVSPFFGTFHGLFYKMLLRSGRDIDIIDGGIVHKIVSNTLNKYFDEVNDDKIKETINNNSLFKTSRQSLGDFKPSISREIFEEAYSTYEHYKEENNKWDFDDLAIKTLEMLKNDKKLLDGYRRLFRYVLVDEFQDCDEMQIDFLRLINSGENNSLFAV